MFHDEWPRGRVYRLSSNYPGRFAGRQEGMQSSITETNESDEIPRKTSEAGNQVSVRRHPVGTPLRISMRAAAFFNAFVFTGEEMKKEREGTRGEIHLARRLDAKTSVLSLH